MDFKQIKDRIVLASWGKKKHRNGIAHEHSAGHSILWW